MGCGDVTVLEARAVGTCSESPLGHRPTPLFLQIRTPGRIRIRASQVLVMPAARHLVDEVRAAADGIARTIVMRG
ncbi:hypothetical protein Gobs01_02077 [Geodermatophilus obscurus DSM 43160]|uniref:Uncharacterized protein n=1 Tax=Geodermatophilus obscurus (strain ATCC 25078 / DSM 43160 / JCM 3152 / CCUG 61914 / KCC A-0152 / KCTC 9177 / NBRC 13315 / NRRL B-3577 / G-20) TaxID=526225 RepID=D2S5D2_GEOOG|nr:hypothetical protein Gobs_2551 [Geodermatophilus obscurus DSM 43160]